MELDHLQKVSGPQKVLRRAALAAIFAAAQGCADSAVATQTGIDAGADAIDVNTVGDTADAMNETPTLNPDFCWFRVERVTSIGPNNSLRTEPINREATTYFSLWPQNEHCQPWIEQFMVEIPDGGDRPMFRLGAEVLVPNGNSTTTVETTFTYFGGKRYKPIFNVGPIQFSQITALPNDLKASNFELTIQIARTTSVRVPVTFDFVPPTFTMTRIIPAGDGLDITVTNDQAGIFGFAAENMTGEPISPPTRERCNAYYAGSDALQNNCPTNSVCVLADNYGTCREQAWSATIKESLKK